MACCFLSGYDVGCVMSAHSAPPFDPRTLPIWQEATAVLQQQPSVAAERMHATALQQRFKKNLAWQAEPRHEMFVRFPALREAAVLIGLLPSPDAHQSLQVVLTQRCDHLDTHPGQIAFPGGKMDAGDADAAAAALREAHEEISLPPAQTQILGSLMPYETGTGFRVTPVVALLQPSVTLVPNPLEVTDIFHVPLDFLMNPANHRKHVWQPANDHRREWFSIPYTDPDGQERFIWGVTAGILRDLYRFLSV
jgi:8-oxo-dGTP pyrophosphatase MutT (NUDIX family)